MGALIVAGLLATGLSGCALQDALSGDDSKNAPDAHDRDVIGADTRAQDASGQDASGQDASGLDASGLDTSGQDASESDSSGADAHPQPGDIQDEDTSSDAADTPDTSQDDDVSDENLGAISMVGLPDDFAMWVADTSAPFSLAFKDADGAPTPAPDEVDWAATPDGVVELRNCTQDSCKIRSLRAGRVTLTAAAQGFRSATVEVEVVGWHTVEAGRRATCAINTRGALYCWGENEHGNLGLGDIQNRIQPTQVRPDLTWKMVSIGGSPSENAGPAVCATTTDGDLYCWGDNSYGRLGIDAQESVRVPTKVSEREVQAAWEQVAMGSTSACGLTDTRSLYCWGRSSTGGLGIEPTPDHDRGYPSEPVLRSGASAPDWRGVSVSYQTVYAWADIAGGANTYAWGLGLLGTGQSERSDIPKLIEGVSFAAVTSSADHRCGLTHGGEVRCWGSNRYGHILLDNGSPRLGCGGPPDYGLCSPFTISLPAEEAVDVSAGESHTCAVIEIDQAHQIRCWGANQYGQLGNGGHFPGSPGTITYADESLVEGGRDWAAVSAGARHTCAITQNQELFCWGERLSGKGGDGRWVFDVSAVPAAVPNPALERGTSP